MRTPRVTRHTRALAAEQHRCCVHRPLRGAPLLIFRRAGVVGCSRACGTPGMGRYLWGESPL